MPSFKSSRIAAPLAVLAIGLTACSSTSTPTSTAGAGGGGSTGSAKVAAVIKGLDNPFFQAMQDGINSAAKNLNINVAVQAAADIGDTTGQADKLTTLAGQDYSCFVVNPISGTNLIQSLAQVSSANKTIVNIDNPLDPAAASAAGLKVATYIGTDNKAAGGKAADAITAAAPAGSEVAIVGGIAGDVTSAARVDGFKAGAGSKVKIVQEEAADWKREVALTKATDIIAAHPNVKAFFAANDDMGLGIVKAVENAGLTGKIAVVSVDGNKDALQSVADGGLTATVAQYPYAIGELGVQACQAAAKGKSLPTSIESPTALVTKDKAANAISKFPQPFETFTNPLDALLKG
jgi:ABC-type sugar transport system substrate-binding protein